MPTDVSAFFSQIRKQKKRLSNNPMFLLFLLKNKEGMFDVLLNDMHQYFGTKRTKDVKGVIFSLKKRRENLLMPFLLWKFFEDKKLSECAEKLRKEAQKYFKEKYKKDESAMAIMWFVALGEVLKNEKGEEFLDILSDEPKKISHQPNLFPKNDKPNQKE